MSSEGLPLPVLFRRALEAGSKAYKLPTIQKETQQLLQAAVGDLRRVKSGIESLGLFSTNETLEDLATGDFVYLLAPQVLAELQSRINIENEYEREEFIIRSQVSVWSAIAADESQTV
jgi:immunoglobulin-binding protein 1